MIKDLIVRASPHCEPTGYPVGGWYATCNLTGLNFGAGSQRVMPRRFETNQAALQFSEKLLAKRMNPRQLADSVYALCQLYEGNIEQEENEYSKAAYTVETRHGPVIVQPMDDWIHCRFLDVHKAKGVYAMNSTSGKWNFHENPKKRRELLEDFVASFHYMMGQEARYARGYQTH